MSEFYSFYKFSTFNIRSVFFKIFFIRQIEKTGSSSKPWIHFKLQKQDLFPLSIDQNCSNNHVPMLVAMSASIYGGTNSSTHKKN